MNVVVNFNKPAGLTSHQAANKIKRIFRAKKAGHTGTLDPMATGILLVCLDEATKISRFLLGMDKTYRAKIKLGERTDTYDACGRVIEKRDIAFVTKDHLISTARQFVGKISQKPPMFSAVKINGEALYKLARKGMEIERPEREVEIYSLEISGTNFPYCEFVVSCSKGTYIRSLCDDLGMRLGTGAHLTGLERTRIGFFDIRDSAVLEDLNPDELVGTDGALFPRAFVSSIDHALSELNDILLDERDYRKAKNGVAIISNKIKEFRQGEHIRLRDPEGNLFGIGRVKDNLIRVERLFNL
jgi:tRNA pseudouridine55 synthase